MADWDRGFPAASYDAWKTREPDYYDDDPCSECRREYEKEIRDLNDEIGTLRALIKGLIDNDPNEDAADGVTVLDAWRKDAREALGIPDPNAPQEEEIAMSADERETAWLLEGGDGYWTGHSLYNLNRDPNEACRFARRDDAERVRCWLIADDSVSGKVFSTALKATEHVWIK